MKVDNRYKNLINNTKIFAVGNIVAKLSQYVIIALCTYKLTTDEFGISETIIQTCAMLVPIFSADIAEGLFRFSMDKNYTREQIISNSMLINVFGTIIALIAIPIEYYFAQSIRIPIYITILTLFELYQVSIKELVRGLGLTKVYMVSGFVNAIAQVLSCILFIYIFDLGITGYILAIATAFACEILYCSRKVSVNHYIRISAISKSTLKDLLKYSLPLAPNKIMWWIISASDRYFVLWLISASATGLYAVAAKFPALITIVVGFFFQAWQISAIENSETDERDQFFSKIFNMLWSTIGVMTAFVIVFIRFVVKLLVSEDFFSSWEYAPFLLVAAAFSAIQSFLGVNYTIAKDSLGALKSTTLAAICNLVLNYILIKNIGIQGATIATLVSYLVVSIYRYIDTKKYVNIEIEKKIGMIITYATIIIECCIIALFPNLYFISVLGLIIVIIANLKMLRTSIHYLKSIIGKRRKHRNEGINS